MTSPNASHRAPLRHHLWSAIIDVVIVVTFVAIGRRNHDEDVNAHGIWSVAAPFLIALGIVWLILCLVPRWRHPVDPAWGASVWVGTVALGMVLRKFVFDDGTATAFVIVATIFLGLGLNGWRAMVRSVVRRRTTS